jgi:hypothetical protein
MPLLLWVASWPWHYGRSQGGPIAPVEPRADTLARDPGPRVQRARAARQLKALDVGLARETYLEAFTAALFAGRLSPAVGDVARSG